MKVRTSSLLLLVLGALANGTSAASAAASAATVTADELISSLPHKNSGGNNLRRALQSPTDGRSILPDLHASAILPTGPGGCSGSQEAVLDVYRSPSGAASPTVLHLPGGAYMTLQGDTVESAGLQYLEAGYTLAVLWYRLPRSATSQSWLVCSDPMEAVEDVAAAMAHLQENASEYNVDVDQIVLSGFSAGGHLAALYSSTCVERGSCPRGQVLHFPFLEKGAKIFCSEVGSAFNNLEEYDDCFPTALADGATQPTVLYHATGDTLVPTAQMTDLVAALEGQGTEHAYYEVEGGGHYLVPFSQVAAVSDGDLDPSGTYASLVGTALSLPLPACVRCDDVPTAWMTNNDQTCATADWHLANKCADDPFWVQMGYCRASCHGSGRGYEGEACCPPRAPPPDDDCVACSDDPTPWMARNGATCDGSTNTILTKCSEDNYWRSNDFCQQSCFDAGLGYDGVTCCEASE